MVSAAEGRPLIEMGSRRTHEQAAVAAARAAYIAGFAGSSNLEAQRRYGVPALGTSAHAFTLLHATADGPDEPAAFRSQVAALGVGTTLLVDTYDITTGVANAVAAAGPRTRRGPHRLRRPRRAGPSGPRPTRRPRRDQDEDRRVERPRRVRDRHAERRTRRQLTASAPRWSPDPARRPRAWSTSSSRSTACPSRSAAATRNPTAAASRRIGWPSRPGPSSRRSFTRSTSRPPNTAGSTRATLSMPMVRGWRARRRLRPGRRAQAGRRRPAQPALGWLEAVPRRAGHPHPHGFVARPDARRRAHRRAVAPRRHLTELRDAQRHRAAGHGRRCARRHRTHRPGRDGRGRRARLRHR